MIKTGNEGYIMTIDCNNEISWTIDAIHAWEITFEESWDTCRILKKQEHSHMIEICYYNRFFQVIVNKYYWNEYI